MGAHSLNLILWDPPSLIPALRPFTYTSPISRLRIGIHRIAHKWERCTGKNPFYVFSESLHPLYIPKALPEQGDMLVINSCLLPSSDLVEEIYHLSPQEVLRHKGIPLAARISDEHIKRIPDGHIKIPNIISSFLENKNLTSELKPVFRETGFEPLLIQRPWDILTHNPSQIVEDLKPLRTKKKDILGSKIPKTCILESTPEAPIFIGKNVKIGHYTIIEGPCAIGDHCKIGPHSYIRSGTTLGPHCEIRGEVVRSVFFGGVGGTTQKHGIFVGDSVVGAGCNLGAGLLTSNTKDNGSNIRFWDEGTKSFIDTERKFCGTMMGDYVSCGIGTRFYPGSHISPYTQLALAGISPRYLPPFSWCRHGEERSKFKLDALLRSVERVAKRLGGELGIEERKFIKKFHQISS
ncbi:MAG: putative sugar nucleotidyl transferase [Cytophagales bacterium]|nr:putative sugar nucleotidyl transferase [Cytophagales bacterium]